jgi:hypothetical protein
MLFAISHRASLFVAVCLFGALLTPAAAYAAEAPAVRPGSNTGVEDFVREYFADVPAMIAVAKCESQFMQYNKQGGVLKNRHGSSATGVMQIMASIHRTPAARLGFDIDTIEGNVAYARYLYEHGGLSPWLASKHCWNGASVARAKAEVEPDAPESDTLTAANEEDITALHTQLLKVLEAISQVQQEQHIASAAR